MSLMGGLFQVIEAVADEPVPSLWQLGEFPPPGWRSTGVEGGADECIDELVERLSEVAPFAYRDGVFVVLCDRDGVQAAWPDEFVDEAPFGWHPTGVRGGIEECLEHIINRGIQHPGWDRGRPSAPTPPANPPSDAEHIAEAARERAAQEAAANQRCRVVRYPNGWWVRVIPIGVGLPEGTRDTGMQGTRAECDAFVQAWGLFVEPMAWRCADVREQREPAFRAHAARRMDDAVRAGLASLEARVIERIEQTTVVSTSLRIEPPPRPEQDVPPADFIAREAERKAAAASSESARRERAASSPVPPVHAPGSDDAVPQGHVLLGSIKIMAGNVAQPGWVPCAGQLLSTQAYPSLFSLLGNSYGGNGSTTFALPDLRGRVPVQADPRSSSGQPALGWQRGNDLVPQGAGCAHPVRTTAELALAFFIAVQGAYPIRP